VAQTFIHHDYIAKEALLQLKNNLVVGNLVHRGYEGEFTEKPAGWHKGDTINIKAPIHFRVKDGASVDVVDLQERSTTMQVNYRKHVAWQCSAHDMTLNADAFSKRFIQPAMETLSNYIDATVMEVAKNYIPNQVGTPGVVPKDYLTYALAGAKLTNGAVPLDNRSCIIDPISQAYLADTLKGLMNPGMVGRAIERTQFGDIAGFKMFTSQNVPTHTCGTAAGLTTNLAYSTAAENATGVVIDQNGSWSNTLTAGDIFTVAGTNGCNPISGADTGELRQFVCTAALSDSGNYGTISSIPGVSPWNIRSSAATEVDLPYQTVVTVPTADAAISIAGSASLSHKVGLAFHRDCIALAMVPLHLPDSAAKKSQVSSDGYTLRVVQFYDGKDDIEYIRIDCLFGIKVINPFLGCRIAAG
jgi:hypothetical protein